MNSITHDTYQVIMLMAAWLGMMLLSPFHSRSSSEESGDQQILVDYLLGTS